MNLAWKRGDVEENLIGRMRGNGHLCDLWRFRNISLPFMFLKIIDVIVYPEISLDLPDFLKKTLQRT